MVGEGSQNHNRWYELLVSPLFDQTESRWSHSELSRRERVLLTFTDCMTERDQLRDVGVGSVCQFVKPNQCPFSSTSCAGICW